VQDWPVAKDRIELQKFWGLAKHFRIIGWIVLVAALQTQFKNTDQFTWSPECDTAFAEVKHAMSNAPVPALPNLNRPLEVTCDA